MDVPTLVRETALGLAGLVVGFGLYAAATVPSRRRAFHCAYVWLDLTLVAVALNQGAARAMSVLGDDPLNWRDITSILISVNALALLLYTTTRDEKGKSDDDRT